MRSLAIAISALAIGCSSPGGDGDGDADAGVRPAIDRERSLVWIEPAVVDEPSIVGLGRIMAAISADGHGGLMLRDWLNEFAITAHSERLGPALLVEELEGELGADPASWDLDALPFAVTAVHNRIDLGQRAGDCGELRVSLASTHPIYAPLHMIFLFRQPDDSAGCRDTAARWAALTGLDAADLAVEAAAILEVGITADRFLLAETVELTVSPWEWRQWQWSDPASPPVNPPLFQTADVDRLNQPGALRDDFLAFVDANSEALSIREIEIPARFRSRSARVPPGVERERLDLGDRPAELAAAIEIVGCPACHTDDAEFVQTTPQRTFSDFYDRELDARADYLADLTAGIDPGAVPFGPLQAPR
jgi:hypothetical protein